MSRRIGPVVAALGLLIALVFLLADELGLGGFHGVGSTQIAGTILGAAVFVVGVWIWRRT